MNARDFTLTDEHATTVSDEVLGAVRDGGGYVHVVPIVGAEADVLITPATTVLFERITVTRPEFEASDDVWPSMAQWPDDYA